MMSKFTIGTIVGVIVLLVSCIIEFEGSMAPAMWQLTSLIWIVFWYTKCMDEDAKNDD